MSVMDKYHKVFALEIKSEPQDNAMENIDSTRKISNKNQRYKPDLPCQRHLCEAAKHFHKFTPQKEALNYCLPTFLLAIGTVSIFILLL
jgi:hypothetical protein